MGCLAARYACHKARPHPRSGWLPGAIRILQGRRLPRGLTACLRGGDIRGSFSELHSRRSQTSLLPPRIPPAELPELAVEVKCRKSHPLPRPLHGRFLYSNGEALGMRCGDEISAPHDASSAKAARAKQRRAGLGAKGISHHHRPALSGGGVAERNQIPPGCWTHKLR